MGRHWVNALGFSALHASPTPGGSHTLLILQLVGSHKQPVKTSLDGKAVLPIPQNIVPDPIVGLRHLAESLGKPSLFSQTRPLLQPELCSLSAQLPQENLVEAARYFPWIDGDTCGRWVLASSTMEMNSGILGKIPYPAPRSGHVTTSVALADPPNLSRQETPPVLGSFCLPIPLFDSCIQATPLTRGSGEVSILTAFVVIKSSSMLHKPSHPW